MNDFKYSIGQNYDFGPPSLEDEIVSVSAWNLWDEVVNMDVRLSFGLDEDCNKVVTSVEYLTPVMDAEFTDLKVDVRTSLEKQGYTKFAEDVL